VEDFSDARALYAKKGLGSRIGWGARPAVIVVDVTNGFTDPDSPVGADLTEVIAETNRVLDVARKSGVPVIFTSIAYDDPDLEGKAELIIAKQRNGPIGTVNLVFLHSQTKFENRAEDTGEMPEE
jgi:nicotinamidase-related amidase